MTVHNMVPLGVLFWCPHDLRGTVLANMKAALVHAGKIGKMLVTVTGRDAGRKYIRGTQIARVPLEN